MPEGHTIHRLAEAFRELFSDERLTVTSPQGRFAAGARLLDGHVLVSSGAWGKQLFLGFAAQRQNASEALAVRWLRVHLGLYGAWTFSGDGSVTVTHAMGAPRTRVGEEETVLEPLAAEDRPWRPPAPRGAVRVRLAGAHAVADLTGPTTCEVISTAQKEQVESRLGPDPLRPDADVEAVVKSVGRSRVCIGQLLMDQAVLAGVGNIYRAESLFRAGVNPLLAGSAVPAEDIRRIWTDLTVLMRDGVATGRIVTTRPEHRGGSSRAPATRQNAPAPADAFYVYHRAGLPCRICGTTVHMRDLAGRKLYWCPQCQS